MPGIDYVCRKAGRIEARNIVSSSWQDGIVNLTMPALDMPITKTVA